MDCQTEKRRGPPDKHLAEGRQGTLVSLQVGRALAALAVVAFHLSYAFADPRIGYEQIGFAYTRLGYLGVDYFFVLSGFIILYAHQRDVGKFSRTTGYILKRIIRIYPIYLIVTLGTLVGVVITGGTKAVPASFSDLASMILLVRFNDFTTPVAQAWTLFHEMLFYIFFALLIINRRLGVLAMMMWLAVILLRFQFTPHGGWSFWSTLSSFQNISFFFGMLAFWLAMKFGKLASAFVAILGALSCVFLFSFGSDVDSSILLRLSYSLAFMLIISGLVGVESNFGKFRLPFLEFMGNASYSIYLTHESMEMVLLKIAKKLGFLEIVPPEVNYIIVIILTIIGGAATFVCVEKPLLKLFRPSTRPMLS